MTSITLPRATVEQALEALEKYRKMMFVEAGCRFVEGDAAITALRGALAQQAEQDLSRCPQCNGPADNGFDRSFPPSPYLCTKCMAEPVEPVAWECRAGGLKSLTQRQYDAQTVAIKRHYTRIAPPQRTMVPLTEEEIFKIENDIPDDVISDRAWTICLTRAVEKAVWEKNHGQA